MEKIFIHLKNNSLTYIVSICIVGLFIYFMNNDFKKEKKQTVHWHMPITYDICGNTNPLSDESHNGKVHGHDDKQIHIEGTIDKNNRKETLGKYFDSFGVAFNDKQIANIKNGFKCPGSKTGGKLQVFVNGNQIKNVKNYVLQKDDKIKIIFK